MTEQYKEQKTQWKPGLITQFDPSIYKKVVEWQAKVILNVAKRKAKESQHG
jgi:hypothetical protein